MNLDTPRQPELPASETGELLPPKPHCRISTGRGEAPPPLRRGRGHLSLVDHATPLQGAERERATGVFTLRLEATLARRVGGASLDAAEGRPIQPPAGLEAAFHTWWGLLDFLATRDERLRFQLRLTKPRGVGRPTAVALAILAVDPDPSAVATLLDDAWGDLRARILAMAETLEWRPVDDVSEAAALLGPFPFESVGELFQQEAKEPRTGAYRVQPFRLRADDLSRVLGALASREEATLFAATLAPTGATTAETSCVGARGRCFEQRVHLASDGPIRDDLVHAVGSAVAGYEGLMILAERGPVDAPGQPRGGFCWHEARGPAIPLALANLTAGAMIAWEPSLAPPELARARRLVDPVTASLAIRLPVRSIDALAGPALPAPADLPETHGVRLGMTSVCGIRRPLRQSDADASLHTYLVGRTGTGKSTLLLRIALGRIAEGHGVALIDPHGDLADALLERIPAHRADDVLVFDPTDVERPVGLNLMEHDPARPEQKSFVINEVLAILDQLYEMRLVAGPIFEQYFRYAFLAMFGDPKTTVDITLLERFFVDGSFRDGVLRRTRDGRAAAFWRQIAERATGDTGLVNMAAYVSSKLTSFVSNEFITPIVGQKRSSFDLRALMDEGRVLVVRLPKGRLGGLNTRLLGMVVIMRALLAALSREDLPAAERRPFHLLADEFQTLVTPSMAELLAEARKYGLRLTMANQNLAQVPEGVRAAVLGNVGTVVAFGLGVCDADVIAQTLGDPSLAQALVRLPPYQAVVRPTIGGRTLAPCLVQTPPLPDGASPEGRRRIVDASRRAIGRPRQAVLAEIEGRDD
ncbi:MAG: hypothetical protein AMXMBFR64_54600 [Myxococcales bacterium]